MRKFRVLDQDWEVKATIASLRRVKEQTNVDLTKLVDPESGVLTTLTSDPFVMFDVVCSLVEPQMNDRQVTAEQLGNAMDEEAAEAASMAVLEAVIDFFPPQRRMLLSRALERMQTAYQRVQATELDKAREQIESVDFDAIVRSASGTPSKNSPASSVATPSP